jgi:hypothetical protein
LTWGCLSAVRDLRKIAESQADRPAGRRHRS